jgi:hypothetical protein
VACSTQSILARYAYAQKLEDAGAAQTNGWLRVCNNKAGAHGFEAGEISSDMERGAGHETFVPPDVMSVSFKPP